jgi:tRNA pseudouridine13 synthase
MTFPLLAPDSKIEDPEVRKAVQHVLAHEKTALTGLRVPDSPELFFKHEERPLLVFPGKLVAGKAGPDALHRGHLKLNVAFTLPPGAYATLVVRRLFHESFRHARKEREQAIVPPDPPPRVPPLAEVRREQGFLARQRTKKAARKARRDAAPTRR